MGGIRQRSYMGLLALYNTQAEEKYGNRRTRMVEMFAFQIPANVIAGLFLLTKSYIGMKSCDSYCQSETA